MSQTPANGSFRVEDRGSAIVVRVAATTLDDAAVTDVARALDEATQGSVASVVVLDLSPVKFLVSMALGALVQLANKCQARQQTLKLAGLAKPLRQMLVITRLDSILELSDTVDAALR